MIQGTHTNVSGPTAFKFHRADGTKYDNPQHSSEAKKYLIDQRPQ